MKIEITTPALSDLCSYCLGSGERRAMQSAMTHDGVSVRVGDIKVKCKQCKGTGVMKHE